MPNTWLVLDCNNLCHRAYHAMGGLSYDGQLTGVVYGFFKELSRLQDRFNTDRVAFCFDRGCHRRKKILPEYKAKRAREDRTLEEMEARSEIERQIEALRHDYLPAIGYRNILSGDGYEADDWIAVAVRSLLPGDDAVMVSSDKDLLQLLSATPRVDFYSLHKKKLVTAESFEAEWGLPPIKWRWVKSIAGCSTDEIPGVKGVGEKTAAKFLRKELKEDSTLHKRIVADTATRFRNLQLVRLPLASLDDERVILRSDAPSLNEWRRLTQRLGFKSFDDVLLRGFGAATPRTLFTRGCD